MPIFTESQLLEKILESNFNTDEPINLLCCINDKFVNPMINLMHSIRHFCGASLKLYVLSTKLAEDSIDLIKEKMEYLNIQVEVSVVNLSDYETHSSAWSLDVYLRVFAFHFMPKDVDKVLSLDSDMLAVGDISSLYKTDVTNALLACAIDIDVHHPLVFERRKRFSIKHEYFNSGMMVLNLKKQREQWSFEMFDDILSKYDFPFNDQDLLNMVCDESELVFVPYKYNFENWNVITDKKNLGVFSPVILHYICKPKPWEEKDLTQYHIKIFYECAWLTGLSEYCEIGEKSERRIKPPISKDKYKHKLCVYAIAKNEEKFVDAWVDSMQEADDIYVLIDGTTSDDTEKLLKARGVHVVKKTINPWRFDTARNESLKLVPEDTEICVCTDLDEIFEPGWREIVDKNWQDGVCCGEYDHWLNANKPNETKNIMKNYKIHSRNGFYWKWAIHEFIMSEGDCKTIPMPGLLLKHYPDLSKPRSYIELLEQAIKDEPHEKRYYEFLIAEAIYSGKWELVEKTAIDLENKFNANSDYDYCFLYKAKCEIEAQRENFDKIVEYCKNVLSKYDKARWFYGELGSIYIMQMEKYEEGIELLKKCLSIKENIMRQYEFKWKDDESIYNYISIGYYNLKDYQQAIDWIDKALESKPNNTTYQKNKKIYQNSLTHQ